MSEPYRLHTSRAEHRLLLRPNSSDLRLSDYAYQFGLIDATRYAQVCQKRAEIEYTLTRLDTLKFTSSRHVEQCAQQLGIAPLGQLLSARELLRRPELHYAQLAQLAQLVNTENISTTATTETTAREDAISTNTTLPLLSEDTAEEVELQVKYENYIRKQEQLVHRTQRLEEMRLPASLDYNAIPHLRTQARQKLLRTLPITVGQASRVEGVTPADTAILMIYLEKLRANKALS